MDQCINNCINNKRAQSREKKIFVSDLVQLFLNCQSEFYSQTKNNPQYVSPESNVCQTELLTKWSHRPVLWM